MKIALLGASRGLGWEVVKLSCAEHESLVVARKVESLKALSEQSEVRTFSCDLSHDSNWLGLVERLKVFKPQRIWYFAGGGPYGQFADKNWRDHQWAWHVSFLTPAFLLHQYLQQQFTHCEQFICVGSAVAEDQPDPKAASYCAAKHALRGLLTTVIEEEKARDIRLFSPGYMDTQMLPPNAHPRQSTQSVLGPKLVAEVFWSWALSSDGAKHFRYS